jgi:hypothetical protein
LLQIRLTLLCLLTLRRLLALQCLLTLQGWLPLRVRLPLRVATLPVLLTRLPRLSGLAGPCRLAGLSRPVRLALRARLPLRGLLARPIGLALPSRLTLLVRLPRPIGLPLPVLLPIRLTGLTRSTLQVGLALQARLRRPAALNNQLPPDTLGREGLLHKGAVAGGLLRRDLQRHGGKATGGPGPDRKSA